MKWVSEANEWNERTRGATLWVELEIIWSEADGNIYYTTHANDTVNVGDAKDIGQLILASMTGKYVTEFAFKRR